MRDLLIAAEPNTHPRATHGQLTSRPAQMSAYPSSLFAGTMKQAALCCADANPSSGNIPDRQTGVCLIHSEHYQQASSTARIPHGQSSPLPSAGAFGRQEKSQSSSAVSTIMGQPLSSPPANVPHLSSEFGKTKSSKETTIPVSKEKTKSASGVSPLSKVFSEAGARIEPPVLAITHADVLQIPQVTQATASHLPLALQQPSSQPIAIPDRPHSEHATTSFQAGKDPAAEAVQPLESENRVPGSPQAQMSVEKEMQVVSSSGLHGTTTIDVPAKDAEAAEPSSMLSAYSELAATGETPRSTDLYPTLLGDAPQRKSADTTSHPVSETMSFTSNHEQISPVSASSLPLQGADAAAATAPTKSLTKPERIDKRSLREAALSLGINPLALPENAKNLPGTPASNAGLSLQRESAAKDPLNGETAVHAPAPFKLENLAAPPHPLDRPAVLSPAEAQTIFHEESSGPAIELPGGNLPNIPASLNMRADVPTTLLNPHGMENIEPPGKLLLSRAGHVLEAVIPNADQGVAAIRAESSGGKVNVSLQATSAVALSVLSAQLPAIEQYLSYNSVPVSQLFANLADHGSEPSAQSEGQPEQKGKTVRPLSIAVASMMVDGEDATHNLVDLRA